MTLWLQETKKNELRLFPFCWLNILVMLTRKFIFLAIFWLTDTIMVWMWQYAALLWHLW